MVLIRIRVDGVNLTGLSLFALGGETGVSASDTLSIDSGWTFRKPSMSPRQKMDGRVGLVRKRLTAPPPLLVISHTTRITSLALAFAKAQPLRRDLG